MTFEKSITFFCSKRVISQCDLLRKFLLSVFCFKWFLAEKMNFELWCRPKSAQIHVKVKEKSFKKLRKIILFSIFFKLSQMLSNDVKTVPMWYVTLKATPKVSKHILGSFEKKFSHRIFDLWKPFFAYRADQLFENGNLWRILKPKEFSRWKLWPRYDRGSFCGSYCNFLSSGFCLKCFLLKDEFLILVPLKSMKK